MQQVTPVLRYAKPKPKVPVNEQGVPIRQRPLPSKPKRTPPPSSVAPEPASGAMRYPGAGEIEPDPDENEVTIQPEQEPQAPFDPTQPATFPATDLGINTLPLLDPQSGFGGGTGHGSGAHHFAESLAFGDVYPQHEAAAHALRAIQDAHAYHDPENKQERIHNIDPNFLGDLPVGHVKSERLPGGYQFVTVHYPQGRGTTYRGRINE